MFDNVTSNLSKLGSDLWTKGRLSRVKRALHPGRKSRILPKGGKPESRGVLAVAFPSSRRRPSHPSHPNRITTTAQGTHGQGYGTGKHYKYWNKPRQTRHDTYFFHSSNIIDT